MYRPLMLVGTASDVGKSILCAAFCRIFKQDGLQPAPFKAQNMSLNSYATPDGLELGRAQAVQAEAAGVPCHTDMNPVLLKPNSHTSSQVVLNGKPYGNQSAYSYFKREGRQHLFQEAFNAFERLNQRYSPVVMEGAGSISELNLKKNDITNMAMATKAGAATLLVGDIDRGGVFGSVYGSIRLLPDHERDAIKGILINKFRGDARLFEDGKKILEDITGKPVLGVIPYLENMGLEEEDSVALERQKRFPIYGMVNIAIPRLPRLSNYTDFAVFNLVSGVNLFYTDNPDFVKAADIVILPGSKNTIEDLLWLKEKGLADAILHVYSAGKKVIGICGGYQMLGKSIEDPYQVESDLGEVKGLGILPVKTILSKEKTTVQQRFQFQDKDELCKAYEIHMGETMIIDETKTLNILKDGKTEGCQMNNCWGTYLHGILDNASVLQDLLAPFGIHIPELDYEAYKENEYNRLADHVREFVDMDAIYKMILPS
ncbi:MAG: cobyric acid synthase CobQ [Thalassobius sp.]|nr:cobyric acid synthase CobQ [Thalassovita sp.]